MPVGRRSRYKPEYAGIVRKMSELGATSWDICEALGISRATFHRWANQHKEFCDNLRLGNEQSDQRVERSLYERACGYSHEDVHISSYEGEVIITPIVKHYPPDTKAALAWLYNRMRDKWHPMPKGEGNAVTELAIEIVRAVKDSGDANSSD
mgnify:CR=1 FL=1